MGLCHLGKPCLSLLDKSPDLLFQLPSRRFEELVAEILEKQGYEVDLTPASGDGGFDMYAAKKDGLGKFLYLVECKRYAPPNKVGVEIIRAVNGVVQAEQATAGAVVTTSSFTRGAREFQREQEHRMTLHDYIALRQWITDYSKFSCGARFLGRDTEELLEELCRVARAFEVAGDAVPEESDVLGVPVRVGDAASPPRRGARMNASLLTRVFGRNALAPRSGFETTTHWLIGGDQSQINRARSGEHQS